MATGVSNRPVQLRYRAENPIAAPVIVSVKYGQDENLDGAGNISFAEDLVAVIHFTKKVIYQNDVSLLQVTEESAGNYVDSVYSQNDSTVVCENQ